MEDANRSGSETPTEEIEQKTQTKTSTTTTTTITTTRTGTEKAVLNTSTKSEIVSGGPSNGASSSVNSSFDVIDAPSSNNASRNDNQSEEMKAPKNENTRYGKCKWFNVAKGWGFITPNDGGQEVFVHQSVIQMSGFRSLGEQEEVEFEAKETERGLEATRVSGCNGIDCHGSTFRPRGAHNRNTTSKKKRRRIRCYNCGEFSNHIAAKCELGPQPKRCHFCKQTDHLYADCLSKKAQTS